MSNNDDGCELSLESWCRTKEGEEVKFNFAWTIKNFSTRPENPGESLYSSVFSLQAPDDIKSDCTMSNPQKAWNKLDGQPLKPTEFVGHYMHIIFLLMWQLVDKCTKKYQWFCVENNKTCWPSLDGCYCYTAKIRLERFSFKFLIYRWILFQIERIISFKCIKSEFQAPLHSLQCR